MLSALLKQPRDRERECAGRLRTDASLFQLSRLSRMTRDTRLLFKLQDALFQNCLGPLALSFCFSVSV
ncbi:hypothetical protein SRHO_G00277050 [Serrasalmus rhombeus]